jgi:hypothetical protein
MAVCKAENTYLVQRPPAPYSFPSTSLPRARPSLDALDPRDQSARLQAESRSVRSVGTILGIPFRGLRPAPNRQLRCEQPGGIVLELEVGVPVILGLGVCGIATRQYACSGAGRVQEWGMSKNKYL